LLWSTYLAGCNTHKAIEDIIEDAGIIRCDDTGHINIMRLESLLAFVNGRRKNWKFEEGLPHTRPL
jgi:hypothetical protein